MKVEGGTSRHALMGEAQGKAVQQSLSVKKSSKFNGLLEPRPLLTDGKVEIELSKKEKTIDEFRRSLEFELNVDHLRKYKDAVRDYLDYFTKHHLSLGDHFARDKMGSELKLKVIRSVDEKVNELTEDMLETNLGHLKTLKGIGEIEGLLVNLYL